MTPLDNIGQKAERKEKRSVLTFLVFLAIVVFD